MITLRKLTIKDLAVVSNAEVSFDRGLSVITGETGTGKSLLVGAVNLLLGERGRSDLVRTGADRACIEGEFVGDLTPLAATLERESINVDGDSLLLTREVSADGRSRCLVNDQRTSVAVLKQLGERICDLHGQHQHQWLLDPDKHLWFLDQLAGAVGLAAAYQSQFADYRRIRERIARLKRDIAVNRERRELYRFQLTEIDAANVSVDEERNLDQERRELENVNRIKERLSNSQGVLEEEGGAIEQVSAVIHDLKSISSDFPAVSAFLDEIESARITLIETGRTLAEHLGRLAEDPQRLEEIGERLSLIYSLKRKYGGSIDSILAHRQDVAVALEQGDSLEQELEKTQSEREKLAAKLSETAVKLQKTRDAAAAKLSRQMVSQLRELGMPDLEFRLEFSDPQGGEEIKTPDGVLKLSEAGLKTGQFLFSANPGEEPRPLSRIASGGEISRVMLALKSLIAGKDLVDVLVFDEIDTGIGGETALLVGRQLKKLAARQQVIAITHLQQIAAFGDYHYRAIKRQAGGRSESTLEALDHSERVAELGRMISGGKLGVEETRQAKKLLAQADGLAEKV